MHWMFLRFPEGKEKVLTFSYDDAVEQDIRLIDLFEKYNAKCTFNINSGLYPPEDFNYPPSEWHRRISKEKATQLYSKSCADVAIHGSTHAHIAQLPLSTITAEFMNDRLALERQFGKIILGACYPYGCNNETVLLAAKATGLKFARNCNCTYDFTLPQDWLNWGPTCHHNYNHIMELAQKFKNDKVVKDPYVFYIWGHSYEFDKNNSWNDMEKLLAEVCNIDEAWYATNSQIYEYVTAFRQLIFSCDGSIIHNPTSITLWGEIDFKPFKIEAGQNIFIDN